MDPVSALGFAVNILTLVDFTSKVLKAGKTVYDEGNSTDNASTEVVVADLRSLRENLYKISHRTVNGAGPLTQDEQVFTPLLILMSYLTFSRNLRLCRSNVSSLQMDCMTRCPNCILGQIARGSRALALPSEQFGMPIRFKKQPIA